MLLSLSRSLSLSLYLSSSLFFCWSARVFSSLRSNVSKVKSLKDCSLKLFSKCNCHCHCLCLCICLYPCVFVGQVMFLVSMTPISFARFRFGLEGWKALNPTQ